MKRGLCQSLLRQQCRRLMLSSRRMRTTHCATQHKRSLATAAKAVQRFVQLRFVVLYISTLATCSQAKTSPAADLRIPDPTSIRMVSADLHRCLFPDAHQYSEVNAGMGPPPLMGTNMREHFMAVGNRQAAPYTAIMDRLLGRQSCIIKPWHRRLMVITGKQLPEIPDEAQFVMREGWMRYDIADQGQWTTVAVNYPPEEALFFDVETLVSDSQAPILAVAASVDAWWAMLPLSSSKPCIYDCALQVCVVQPSLVSWRWHCARGQGQIRIVGTDAVGKQRTRPATTRRRRSQCGL